VVARSGGICHCDNLSQARYRWVTRPPNKIERIVAGIWLALMLFALANVFAGWQFFGQYDGAVPIILNLVAVLSIPLIPKTKRIETNKSEESF
jgi:hypothetical protein